MNETMERWCFATNMQTFEHAGLEAVNMLMGPVSEALSLWLQISHASAYRIAILLYKMKLVWSIFGL